MSYLKKYGYNFDTFRSFLKKYQKSNYIPISAKKLFTSKGYIYFKKIEDSVHRCQGFLYDNDEDLFLDYFRDIRDMYPHIINQDLSFYIKSNSLPYNINIDYIGDPVSIIQSIVNEIEISRAESIKNYGDRRDFKWIKFDRSRIREIEDLEILEGCIIHPAIILRVEYDEILEENDHIQSNRDISHSIKSELNIMVISYLNSIGYYGNFTINERYNYDVSVFTIDIK